MRAASGAHGSASGEMRFGKPRRCARPAGHGGRDRGAARKCPPPQATMWTSSPVTPSRPGGLEPVHLRHGQIVDRREFFWKTRRIRRAAVFSSLLSSSTWTSSSSRRRSTCPWSSRTARRWRSCFRKAEPPRGDTHAPAWAEESAPRLGPEQRQTQLDMRFHVLKPFVRAIQEGARSRFDLPAAPRASSPSTSPTSRAPTGGQPWCVWKTAG